MGKWLLYLRFILFMFCSFASFFFRVAQFRELGWLWGALRLSSPGSSIHEIDLVYVWISALLKSLFAYSSAGLRRRHPGCERVLGHMRLCIWLLLLILFDSILIFPIILFSCRRQGSKM